MPGVVISTSTDSRSHIDDIIASMRAANRQKDRESLDRLVAFSQYLKSR